MAGATLGRNLREPCPDLPGWMQKQSRHSIGFPGHKKDNSRHESFLKPGDKYFSKTSPEAPGFFVKTEKNARVARERTIRASQGDSEYQPGPVNRPRRSSSVSGRSEKEPLSYRAPLFRWTKTSTDFKLGAGKDFNPQALSGTLAMDGKTYKVLGDRTHPTTMSPQDLFEAQNSAEAKDLARTVKSIYSSGPMEMTHEEMTRLMRQPRAPTGSLLAHSLKKPLVSLNRPASRTRFLIPDD